MTHGDRATELRFNLIELAQRLDDVISLGRGDPDLDTPPHIIEGGVRRLEREPGHGGDVRGLPALRQRIAARYRRDKQLDVDPEREVLVTNGAQEGLFLAMLALVDEGDGVLVTDPRYSSYDQAIAAAGGRLVEIPTSLANDFVPDPDDVRRLAPGARVLVLVNPANPTSAFVPPAVVREIAEAARNSDVTVLSDEIYEHLVFDGGEVLSVATCDAMRDRTVTLSGFSKTYAMTGFRMGYLLGPPEFIDAAARLKRLLSGPCPLLSQYAALEALEGPQECVRMHRRIFDQRRRLMMAALDRLGIPYGRPGGAFYVWADVSRYGVSARAFCHRLLTEARVLAFPGDAFGERWQSFVRLSLLQPEDRLREAIGRIEEFVGRLGPPAG